MGDLESIIPILRTRNEAHSEVFTSVPSVPALPVAVNSYFTLFQAPRVPFPRPGEGW